MNNNFGAFSERKFRGKNFLDKVAGLEARVKSISRAENLIDASALEGTVRNWAAEVDGEMRAGDLGDGQVLMLADAMEISWWLPLTLADDDVTIIYCQVIKTISGVKYLYVGGTFTRIGGVAAVNVARYNFSTRAWEAIDDGSLSNDVYFMAFDSADDLYIGGEFLNASGVATADKIAKLSAGVWTAVNGGVNGYVASIIFDGSGVMYIGGGFTDAGGDADADYIARDDGAGSWENVNGGVNSDVYTMAFSPDEVLYIGGAFTDAGGDADADYIARDDGAGSWENVNGGLSAGSVRALGFDASGVLYIGGVFFNAGGDTDADYIAREDGTGSWENIGGGLTGTVTTIIFDADGILICGGFFTDAGGVAEADGIAWFDGQSWQALSNGGGLSGLSGQVYSVVADTNRTVYAGGSFNTAGTIQCAGLAAFVRPLADGLDMIAGLFEQYQARATAAYAPIAKGVTNGDSHDHIGGDGGQINHTGLSNIGANTHAQIDTHIALNRWTTLVKATSETLSSDTTFQVDDDLVVTVPANKTMHIRGSVFFTTPAAADFKYRFAFGGTLIYVHSEAYPAGSATPTNYIDIASASAHDVLGAATTGGHIEFDAIVTSDASVRAFQFQWAQVAATGTTTVLKGSYLDYIQVD